MGKSRSLLWLFAACACAVVATIFLLSYMVTDPGHTIIQLGGDCGKNYFTFLYHAVHDNGVWFQGMNYPYGEHIIYGDGQPILSTTLQLFHVSVSQALGIMNLAIALSYVLAIVFTYKILERFGVQPFIAILFACIINLCAPQVLRLRAHFALAYLNSIPMLFYWSLLYHYSSRWKYVVYIFIMGFIMAFMHLYTGGLIFIWVACYALGYMLLIKRPLAERVKHILPILVSAGCLFLVIKLCIALTDPIKDRPKFPLNTLEYVTGIKDIISSPYSFMSQYMLRQKWLKNISDGGEGFTYLGLISIIAIAVSVVAGIVKKLKRRPASAFIVSEEGFSPVWVFVGVGSLLFAMGVPFIWNMQWLLNYLSLFKQFRAMGRFSWTFYYIATIYSVVVIHHLYVRCIAKKRLVAGYAVLIIAFGVWAFESKDLVSYTRDYIAHGQPTYDEFIYKGQPGWAEYLATQHYKGSDFQGILLLPFFMMGSEKLWVGGDPSWPLSIGMRPALDLKLPIVDVMMSRTSWSLTEKQVKTAAGSFVDKPMLRDLPNMKPFLVIQHDGTDLGHDELYLLKDAVSLGHNFGAYIYACYPEKIIARDKRDADAIRAILPYVHNGDTCIEDKGTWYTDHLDKKQTGDRLFGSGAMPIVNKDSFLLADVHVLPRVDGQQYELSCWFLLDDEDYRSPYVNIQQIDSAGNMISVTDALTKLSVDNKGMWFRAANYVSLKADCRQVKCYIVNLPSSTYKLVDELQLRPSDATIISQAKDGSIMVNNHLFNK